MSRSCRIASFDEQFFGAIRRAYDLFFCSLIVGPEGRHIPIDVLKCKTDESSFFFLTKGRRYNSVYFVYPLLVNESGDSGDFKLNEKFKSDIKLEYPFTRISESVLEETLGKMKIS